MGAAMAAINASIASMKALPKRKGNGGPGKFAGQWKSMPQ